MPSFIPIPSQPAARGGGRINEIIIIVYISSFRLLTAERRAELRAHPKSLGEGTEAPPHTLSIKAAV